MANILKNPTHRAQIGYNGFDMSHILNFSSTTGELLPVYMDLLQPDDKVTLATELKTRTMELASASMVRINEHLDWFFVPITQIYSLFGDFYYQIQDVKTSLVTPSSVSSSLMPYISPGNMKFGPLGNTDMFGRRTMYRLLDCFIPYTYYIRQTTVTSSGAADNFPVSWSPIFLCAYQKIWMDHYRLTDRDANDPNAYNLDKFYINPSISPVPSEMLKLRYRPVKKDYFTNQFVSPLFSNGDVGSIANSVILNSVSQWLVSYQATALNASYSSNDSSQVSTNPTTSGLATAVSAGSSASQSATTSTLATAVNVARNALSPTSIRTSFALQKLMEITRRAGKHYDKQTLAHFGADVPNGISGEVVFIGSSDSVVNIGDVIATSTGSASVGGNTTTSVLGQVGGKGYGYDKSHSFKYQAPCHGILMCIYSADVDRSYANFPIDRIQSLVRRSDWFTPEYDNLGMQPLFGYNCDFDPTIPGDFFTVAGWQYRYMELKCKYNKNRGALDMSGNLSYWVNQTRVLTPGPQTTFRNFFYNSPIDLNNIMLVNYSEISYTSNSTGVYTFNFYPSDPLIHQLYFDVKKASKMSTYGLESL